MEGKIKEDILIAEYDGMKFKPYKENSSFSVEFSTYKECEEHIKKHNFIGYAPEVGWGLGLGNYRNNFGQLMRVVEKICKEDFDDDSRETSYLRTFGMINDDGDFMVRFNRGSLHIHPTLIGATFSAVIDYLRNQQKPKL